MRAAANQKLNLNEQEKALLQKLNQSIFETSQQEILRMMGQNGVSGMSQRGNDDDLNEH